MSRRRWLVLAVILAGASAAWAGASSAWAGERPDPDQLLSGYWFARPDTQAIQDDEFANPGYLWLDKGARYWRQADGAAGESCAGCHGDAGRPMAGVATAYPKVSEDGSRLVNLGQRINQCRVEQMATTPFEPESDSLLALEIYVAAQSNGMALNVAVDGPAAPFFVRGEALYTQRVGHADLACTQCHDQRVGNYLRAEHISQGHINAFPAYIVRWDRLASVHRRFQFCNAQARAEPLPIGAADYNALQLYVAWRGQGLAIEVPSVRR